jgi:hypothetical protein
MPFLQDVCYDSVGRSNPCTAQRTKICYNSNNSLHTEVTFNGILWEKLWECFLRGLERQVQKFVEKLNIFQIFLIFLNRFQNSRVAYILFGLATIKSLRFGE